MVKPVLFGKFCLLERISVGGMAEVFRAKPLDAPGFEKFLAIKRILPNLAEDDEFIAMFIDEAKIAVQLTHSNICQIFELGHLHDSYYIVMEFIAGRDILAIQNRLRRERRIMSVGQAAYLAQQIALGLNNAHGKADEQGNPQNIIHRDISPQNILVSYSGEVKVIDFGIAKAATRSNKTQVGVLKGKFGYMSPEQVKGLDLDHRSDIFALGTLLHEMLTCRRLFHGESDFATLEKVRRADVPKPSELNPNVPPEIDNVVMTALQLDANDRYQTCGEMADALQDFLAKLRPPYTERTLEDWMQRTFHEEIKKEVEKRQIFSRFKTRADVEAHNEKMAKELAIQMGLGEDYEGQDDDQLSDQATQIWDTAAQGLPLDGLPGTALDDYNLSEDATVQDLELSTEALAALHTQIADMSKVDAPGPTEPWKPPADLKPPTSSVPQPTGPVAYIPPSMAHLYPNSPTPVPQKAPVSRLGIALVSSFVLMSLLIIGALAWLFFATDMGRGGPTTGSMLVKSEPVQEVEVLLNGDLIATRTPHMASELAPGRYTVEVRGKGYKPATLIVTIDAGQQAEAALSLVTMPVGEGVVTVNIDPPEAELYVDGKRHPDSGATRSVKLDDQAPHMLEARLAGYYVEEATMEVEDGQRLTKTLRLRRVRGEISVDSAVVGRIYVDGTKVGETPYKATDLDPLKTYEIEIRAKGYHPWKKTVVFFQSHTKNYTARLRSTRDDPPPEEIVKVGYLVADTGPTWWRVKLDGWDTGLTTPVIESRKLTLPVGEHTITFARGESTHAVKIEVKEGRTVSLNETYALKN